MRLYGKLSGGATMAAWCREFDADLAREARESGCSCGGVLHCADYPRKPRGESPDASGEYRKRFSFCCAREGCRRRRTPASLRFLGRRVYVGVTVILAAALCGGLTDFRVRLLRRWLGVSLRTLQRWRYWWQEEFVETPFWRGSRGDFRFPVEASGLPVALLRQFEGETIAAKLFKMLGFLKPLSVGSRLCVVSAM